MSVSPLALDGGVTSDAVTLFVERAGTVRPGFGIFDEQTAAAVVEICETLDGLPLGIELGAARMAAMSAAEVRDRLGDRFRLLTGPEHGPDRQSTLRSTVAWSVRPAGRRRTSRAADGVGVCRRLRPARVVRRRRGERRRGGPAAPGLVGAQVPRRRSSRCGADPVQHVRDHPDVRPRDALGDDRTRRRSRSACRSLRDRSRAAMGAVERARVARRGRLGAGRAGQPAVRLPVERRPWPGRGGDRCRRPCCADGLLGRAVRDDRVGRGVARGGGASRRSTATSAVRRGRVCLLRGAGRGRDRERPPRHRAGGATGVRVLRARLRDVHRGPRTGLLRKSGSLCRADQSTSRRCPGRAGRTGSPPTSTGSSRPAGSRRRWSSPLRRSRQRATSATRTGWPTRRGSSGWRGRRQTRSEL